MNHIGGWFLEVRGWQPLGCGKHGADGFDFATSVIGRVTVYKIKETHKSSLVTLIKIMC